MGTEDGNSVEDCKRLCRQARSGTEQCVGYTFREEGSQCDLKRDSDARILVDLAETTSGRIKLGNYKSITFMIVRIKTIKFFGHYKNGKRIKISGGPVQKMDGLGSGFLRLNQLKTANVHVKMRGAAKIHVWDTPLDQMKYESVP